METQPEKKNKDPILKSKKVVKALTEIIFLFLAKMMADAPNKAKILILLSKDQL